MKHPESSRRCRLSPRFAIVLVCSLAAATARAWMLVPLHLSADLAAGLSSPAQSASRGLSSSWRPVSARAHVQPTESIRLTQLGPVGAREVPRLPVHPATRQRELIHPVTAG